MKILLDCRFQKGAGPNIAVRHLLDHLLRLNIEYEFVILQHQRQPLPNYPGIKKITVPSRNRLLEFLYVQYYFPKLLQRYHIDIYHSFKHVGPLFTSVPTIVTLHSIRPFSERQEGYVSEFDLVNKIYWKYIHRCGLKQATHIISISHDCKKVITERLGIPEYKISVIYHGLDKKFRVIQDPEAIAERRRRYSLPEKYILCVGNFYPYKNSDTVVKMFLKLREQNKEAPKLVMVGDTTHAGSQFFKLINELTLGNDIIFTNYVEQDDMVYIYNGATLLVFPPSEAGFGLPLLEAMACGVPIVASDRGAIAEITGGAALLLKNPRDEGEMLNAVCRVLEDHQLRQTLQQKGYQRAQEFSWETSALKVLDLYKTIGRENL